jgi:pimeloyl-ACP methyl ester carboxylesterase
MSGQAPVMISSNDGVQIALHDLGGPGPDAPLLLFSHATGFHGRVWEPLASLLNNQFRCVALDLRGHGLSDLPAGVGLAWSSMADDILTVLDSALFPIGLVHGVGHSMGAAALVLASGQRPEVFRSLWLYEPAIAPSEGWPYQDGDNPAIDGATRRRERFDSLERAYDNFRSKSPLDQLHPDVLRAYVDGGFAPTPDGSVTLRCLPAVEAEIYRQATVSGAWETVTSVAVPVAIVAGRPDGLGPRTFASTIAATLPRGSLVERPGLGHFGPLEDPVAMAADLAGWIQTHS